MAMTENTSARAAAITSSGWGVPVRFIQFHNPAFWLYALLLINGVLIYYHELTRSHVYASSLVFAIGLQVLYVLPFLWFITRTDRYEREPSKLAILGFLWGGLIATWVIAVPGNAAMLSIWSKLFGLDFATTWGPPLTAPFVEETAKYAGLVMLVLLARSHVRSAYDGLLLGAFTGLGFQAFENVQYIIQAVAANFNSAPVQDALTIFVVRSATGLFSHALYTAIAGTGLGYFVGATGRSAGHRVLVALGFLAIAMVAHGSLDAAGALGLLALPINIAVSVVGGIIAWRFADRRQREWMRELMKDEVASGTVTEPELAVLAGPRKSRGRYLKSIKREHGKTAAKREGYVLDAEIDLAAAIAATDNPESPEAVAARAELTRVRALAKAV